MANLAISYNPNNVIAAGLIDLLSKVEGVTLYEDEEYLTVAEMAEIEASEQSGISPHNIEYLKEKLRQ